MTMVVQQYAPLARRTLKELPYPEHLIHMALGLAGEIGELLDAVKKHVIYGKPLDIVNLSEELGDDFWYAANLLPELRVTHDAFEVAMQNGAKNGAERRKQIEAGAPPEKVMFVVAVDLLQLNTAMGMTLTEGLLAQQLMLAQPPEQGANQSSMAAVRVIESIAGVIGTIAGLLNLDCGQAMRSNIEKLAKRYGDKYSDIAALNRDTDAERAVLEGGSVH